MVHALIHVPDDGSRTVFEFQAIQKRQSWRRSTRGSPLPFAGSNASRFRQHLSASVQGHPRSPRTHKQHALETDDMPKEIGAIPSDRYEVARELGESTFYQPGAM
jgi:hypothetical protein